MSILLALAAAIVPAGQSFACTPIRVWDGDGPIWCAEGPHVRLSGIAAREMDGTCNAGQPCPPVDPITSRDALASLVGAVRGQSREGHVLVSGPALSCLSIGGAGGSRTAAWSVAPTCGDLSCVMVQNGWALKWERYWCGHFCNGQ